MNFFKRFSHALCRRLSRSYLIRSYEHLLMDRAQESPGQLRVFFYGVSTLLFTDGDTAILTDGFFSRPRKRQVFFGRIGPDSNEIKNYVESPEFNNLKAVIVLHSHYDHSLDSAEVAKMKEVDLIGTESTKKIAEGYSLADEKIKVIDGKATFPYGRFEITLLKSRHSPRILCNYFGKHRVLFPGDIRRKLTPPACLTKFKEGDSYSLLIKHGGRTMLVQASADFLPGALNGRKADVVFLGVGTLGKLGNEHRKNYWRGVVEPVGARRVIPIHWDDFFRSLEKPLLPTSRFGDNFKKTMDFLLARRGENMDVKLLQKPTPTDPFAGLEKASGDNDS